MGIYNNNSQKIIFSNNLIFLEIINNENEFTKLINFFGEGSINNSNILLSSLGIDFSKMVDSAIFIKKRRWNILLKNKILLKLPEKKIFLAIQNYQKIYSNLSNNELQKILSIDLRINDQAIIKYRVIND